MSDHKPQKTVKPPRAFGWMAEYDDENKMLEAARKVRDAGYTRTDVFAPFPVHGIDEALGIKPTILPWFSLIAGATGTGVALLMQCWMNAVDYPYIISGKPFISLPAFIPVTFELTVLFAAFTTVFAMLALNGLPRLSNPVFTNPKFDRATDDRFFLWVDARDKYFNSDSVKSLLQATGPLGVEEVREDDSSTEIPKGLYGIIGTLILLTIIPLTVVWNIRSVRSGSPRWHVFFDMDFQPFRKAQKETTQFADGRTERPPVPGTVARGTQSGDDPYFLGYTPANDTAAIMPSVSGIRLVSAQEESPAADSAPANTDAEPADSDGQPAAESSSAAAPEPAQSTAQPPSTDQSTGELVAEDPSAGKSEASQQAAGGTVATGAEPDYAWLSSLPEQVQADDRLFELGQRKFNQVCAVCHGYAGYGNGLVTQRAESIGATYWLQPTSVHDPRVQQQPLGRVYYTITHGKGKMAGYSSSLNVQERWAVAVYVKSLQRSQNAQSGDVPPDTAGQ
ncbi:MAG: DUF3341 domain-containing protein [Pirellulaceae bacterium]|nr:DUF3341 domain-containing protein [Pirellulaceae bacterium]